jgi:hypothetical protein
MLIQRCPQCGGRGTDGAGHLCEACAVPAIGSAGGGAIHGHPIGGRANGTPALAKPTPAAEIRERTAKRLRKQNELRIGSELIVVCPQCGDRFSIAHEVPCLDPSVAKQHSEWLLDHFVWDHIQENKHRGSISLPNAEELTRWARTNREP